MLTDGNIMHTDTKEDKNMDKRETKGCFYCKDILDDYDGDLSIYDKNDPKLTVIADDPGCGNDVRINFCPCCGRRLREVLLEYLDTLY